MMNTSREVYKRLHQIIRREAMLQWDPIGIADTPECADEYDSYIPRFVALVMQGAPVEEIVAVLTQIERERMGLQINETHTLKFARYLSNLSVDN